MEKKRTLDLPNSNSNLKVKEKFDATFIGQHVWFSLAVVRASVQVGAGLITRLSRDTAFAMSGFELQDEIQALQDIQSYVIQNEHDIHTEDPGALLEGAYLATYAP